MRNLIGATVPTQGHPFRDVVPRGGCDSTVNGSERNDDNFLVATRIITLPSMYNVRIAVEGNFMHQWLVSLTMVLLISGCGIPTQLRYPPSSPAPDAVRIVKSGGDSNTFFNPSVNTLIQNPQSVTYLFEDLQQMALVRSGPHSCPNDFGTTYTLTFFHGNSKVLTVVADPTGCRDISMNGHAESAMTPSGNTFWETIQTTLRLTSAQLVGERIWVPLSAILYKLS